jgi:hypothetical protein
MIVGLGIETETQDLPNKKHDANHPVMQFVA